MGRKSNASGCFKYGCVGCLSVLALCVGLTFLLTVVRLSGEAREPEPVELRSEHPLPALGDLPQPDGPTFPEVLPLPELAEFPRPDQRTGRLVLDLRMGEFVIRPGPADQPIRVEADFDASSFELTEEFSTSEDSGWTYEVTFGSRRGLLGMLLGGGQDGRNRVEVIIPRGHPVDIVGSVGFGELKADLGGLWIRDIDLELGTGDMFIEFRDPLPYPMDSFRIDASIGEVELRRLGDASPRTVEVDHGFGELFVDLKGAWAADAEIDIDFGIGEARLWLPDDVHVEIVRASVGIGESSIDIPDPDQVPEGAPTLTVRIAGNLGEVQVEY